MSDNPKAKKQFGQNFLTNPAIPERIVKESGIQSDFGVIEIGPGRGILTEQLAKAAKKVVAVEIDKELIPILKEKFASFDNVEIIEGDFMETDVAELIRTRFDGLPVAVCANIPYYITSPIVLKLLEGGYKLESITVMVQKEVAQRLCAKKKTPDYSSLTVLCDYYSKVRRLFAVPAGCFTPKPNVDSAVIRFDVRKEKPVFPFDEKLFKELIRVSFAYRRKTFANCLQSCSNGLYTKEIICDILKDVGLDPNVRGEELDIYDLEKITNKLYILQNGGKNMALTKNKKLNAWLDEMIELCGPASVEIIDGSEEQAEKLRAIACSTGEMFKLNEEKLPGCYLHRTAVNDVARVEGRTFICTPTKEEAGATNNWMDPEEMRAKLLPLYKNSYNGKIMYVIPYSMGVVGSPFAKNGIELTDSIYVVLNMLIMTRVGTAVLDAMGEDGDFIKGLHSRANMDEENKYIVHFPQDNTIWSINSGYGGNVLLGKKCFALRIASYLGRNEGWMAEHMLILGIEYPNGEVKYVAAAFPSACGKTNLAMLIPPEVYRNKGYKVWTVGDDIAWIRPGADGRLWAANPENGFFGVAPGTNVKSNPNALYTTQANTIFTNVALDTETNTVWWEGLDKNPPKKALSWKGEPWDPSCPDKVAHPNSRFTAPARQCPCISKEFDNPAGVPLSAIIFGGRRAKTAPLVYQSFDWNHGTFVGSIMASETTAAASGAVGVVRRDPMAMLPFCGYNMGDYFQHWLDMGKSVAKLPKIFHVNWFRLNDEGKFMWPGYGDNFRVLEWIIKRCEGTVDAKETEIGYVPYAEDINLEGLDYKITEDHPFTIDDLRAILNVEKDYWLEDIASIQAFYDKIDSIGNTIPAELKKQLAAMKERLSK